MDTGCSTRTCAPLSAEEVLARFGSTAEGLTADEARRRLNTSGKNHLPKGKKPTLLRRVIAQLTSPLILILCAVAVIVPFIGEAKDALIIVFVLAFNTTIGLVQEGRASRALETLERSFVVTCTVKRDGKKIQVNAEDVVEGDLVLLAEGDQIPADGRWIETEGLRVQEASLTGESSPVDKTADAIELEGRTAIGDIVNAGFAQTLVVAGKGTLAVTATGTNTEVGKIAVELSRTQTEPPLAAKVRVLGRTIAIVVLVFSSALFLIGVASGRPALTLFATIASLAVSLIPEGLPIVLTLVLARGVGHMAAKHAVVKRLNAVEGLGQVQVICTDKTGTLTTNELVVRHAWANGHIYDVEGEGFGPEGQVEDKNGVVELGTDEALDSLALAAQLFGDEALRKDEHGEWRVSGDPVNAALLSFSWRYGMAPNGWKTVEEKPFDYKTRLRFARFEREGDLRAYAIGSPESVLGTSTEVPGDVTKAVHRAAQQGLRVIAIATRDGSLPLNDPSPWTPVGFVAMGDTLRPRVVESVAWCREQHIRVVMVTGDHPDTALAIARAAGIAERAEHVVNGPDLEAMDDTALQTALDTVRVFSRITPEHKVRIVEAYRKKGLLTAMTGDGVNDAPALHQADIGIAMGKGGTDVAREAAHLVLLDDNFATIVDAIKEGRATLANVRRVLMYLFSTNVAEAAVISVTLLAGFPLPLLPGQIIWINLVTDSFLDISLGLEPPHGTEAHRARQTALVDRHAVIRMLLLGGTMGVGTFMVYAHVLGESPGYVQTMTLTTLAAFQWLNAWNARSETKSISALPPFSNRPLVAATGVVIGLHLLAVYAPPFQALLGTVPLALSDWGIAFGIASSVIAVDEVWKKAGRLTRRSR